MKYLILCLLAVLSSTSFAADSTDVTCELRSLGKVLANDSMESKVIASVTEKIDSTGGFRIQGMSNSGLTKFMINSNSNFTNIYVVNAKLKNIASSSIHGAAKISTDIFIQTSVDNTEDGNLVLNCFGNKVL